MKRNAQQNGKKGFSFIELLIAVTIFAVGILAIVSLQGVSLMATDFGGNMSVARVLVSDQMERLHGLSFTSAALNICGGSFCHGDIGGGVAGGAPVAIDFTAKASVSGRFLRDWAVENTNPIDANAKAVTVRVRWTDTKGGPSSAAAQSFNRSVSMSSIKTN